ncbi:hypothetical protein BC834DRAFT_46964 [Gloeopeniophorella convolvens]|nr:hypothetical protein BC834DRAFT_46964 [Gloeopeniophorella convolvens]
MALLRPVLFRAITYALVASTGNLPVIHRPQHASSLRCRLRLRSRLFFWPQNILHRTFWTLDDLGRPLLPAQGHSLITNTSGIQDGTASFLIRSPASTTKCGVVSKLRKAPTCAPVGASIQVLLRNCPEIRERIGLQWGSGYKVVPASTGGQHPIANTVATS